MARSILALAALLAISSCFAAAVAQGLTPAQIVSNINMLTSKSQALQAPAQSITLVNGPLIVVGLGPFPQIIAGFTDIITTVTNDVTAMKGTAPVTDAADAASIADAFREFVRVHQVLLNILIGKAGLFETVPIIGAPVAATLRQLESVVDTVAFALIDMVQSQSTDLMSQANSLDMTLGTAIKAYSGVDVSNAAAAP